MAGWYAVVLDCFCFGPAGQAKLEASPERLQATAQRSIHERLRVGRKRPPRLETLAVRSSVIAALTMYSFITTALNHTTGLEAFVVGSKSSPSHS